MAAETRFHAMGSSAHVIVNGDPGLLEVARERIEQLEARWSRFIPSSEVSVLNSCRGRAVHVSPDTFELVRTAVQAWWATSGAFDPTVLGDLIRAGYDRPIEAVVVDPSGGISSLQRDCGGIRLDPDARTVTLPRNAGFDPGGIGKGLAADMVVFELLELGAEGACVNIGGDLRVDGVAPLEERWLVAIEHPARPEPATVVALARGAVATSTISRRAWSVGGVRRHHLIDPASGRPVVGPVVSVSALAGDAATAEVATKAAFFASPGQVLEALERLGCCGLAVGADGRVHASSGLNEFEIDGTRERRAK
jgi:thiamine biosynthesis lipoprotein